MSTALEGIRVLDLADRSATMAGRILADLGAEVILVEPPAGSPVRALRPFLDDEAGPDRSFAHLYFNANKASVVLDPTSDPDSFLALVATADVVLETERPGRLDELGLSHERLLAAKPDLIHISVTPHGLDGPWRDRLGTDLTAAASGGLLAVSGQSRGTPVQGGADPSYVMAGLGAASAALIALTDRDGSATDDGDEQGPTGGVHIDISVQEAATMAVMQTSNPTHWAWRGRVPGRPGLSAAMRCADGGYVSHFLRPDRFERFIQWLDDTGVEHELTTDDWELSLLTAPRTKDNPVVAATLELASKLTRDEFADGALEADIVCLPVFDFTDVAGHEQYLVNEQFVDVAHEPLGRALSFVRSPVDGMGDGVDIARAPTLGEHQHLLDDLAPASTVAVTSSTATAPSAAARPKDPARALEGIRVVDFGWVLAAPIGTRLLASFGAEVIRVESERKPDSMRSQPGPDGRPDPDLGGLYNTVNAGKKSLAIDLSHPEGLDLVKDLIATADVVVNNFRPGAMARMGLGFDVLTDVKPDVVLLNLPGAHPKGPWAVRSSMGNILMAASGFNMLTGFDGEPPRGIGIPYPDFTSPHLLVTTILAALRHRDRTGGGQEIGLTQLSSFLALMGAEWMGFRASGELPARRANRDPNHCPHGVYPTTKADDDPGRDAWVAVAVAADRPDQWPALCRALGRPELIEDPRFATHDDRKANEDELDAIVAGWTSGLDKWKAAAALQEVGVAAAPVEHLADTYERDPHLRGHYQIVHQPVQPDVDIPIDREMAQWRGAELVLRRAPAMGEHNEQVVREMLGRSEEDYIRLIVDEILG